jgi:hypothetical protein
MVTERVSRNTEAASSKAMPCFRRFERAFSGCQRRTVSISLSLRGYRHLQSIGRRSISQLAPPQSRRHCDFFCLLFNPLPLSSVLCRPPGAHPEIADSFFVATKRCVLDDTEAPEALRSLAASLTRWRRRGKLRIDSITSGDNRIAGPSDFREPASKRDQQVSAIKRFQRPSRDAVRTIGGRKRTAKSPRAPAAATALVFRRPSSYSLSVYSRLTR